MLRLLRLTFAPALSGRLRLRGAATLGVALLLAGGSLCNAVHPASAGGCADTTMDFVHTATTANTFGDYTYFDEPSQPILACQAEVAFVTPIFDPGGDTFGTMDSHQVGVWYDLNVNRWAIFNEDATAMPVNASFYVHMTPPGTTSPGASSVFVQTANVAGSYITYLNDPALNGNPNAHLIVTQDFNYEHIGQGSVPSIYDPHEIGIWYNPSLGQWSIYNEDIAAIPTGAEFNVLVAGPSRIFAIRPAFTQTATAANTSYAPTSTCFSSPISNDNPNQFVFVTHIFSGYFTDVPGVWYAYALQEWCIFDVSYNNMPVGAEFSVLLI